MKTILVSIAVFCASLLSAKTITKKDILIVEISGKDVGISPISESAYQENSNERKIVRQAIADFVNSSSDLAKFIIVDCYFPDLLDKDIDGRLAATLKNTKNVVIGGGSYPDREYTNPFFTKAATEVGHLIFQYGEKDAYTFFPEICADWAKFWQPINECPKDKQQRYVAIIAAEKYLDTNLEMLTDGFPTAKHMLFKSFPRISYSTYLKNKNIAKGKLVIVLPRILPTMYVHTTVDKRLITDAEIIATAIIEIFQYLPRK